MPFSKEHQASRRSFGTGVVIIGLFVTALAVAGHARQTEVRREREDRVVTPDGGQKSPSEKETRVSWKSDGLRVEVRARNVEFTEDGSDVKSIAAGGYLYVDDERGGAKRRLKVLPGADGTLQRTLTNDGKAAPFDAAAREWLGKLLVEFLRNPEHSTERHVKH